MARTTTTHIATTYVSVIENRSFQAIEIKPTHAATRTLFARRLLNVKANFDRVAESFAIGIVQSQPEQVRSDLSRRVQFDMVGQRGSPENTAITLQVPANCGIGLHFYISKVCREGNGFRRWQGSDIPRKRARVPEGDPER